MTDETVYADRYEAVGAAIREIGDETGTVFLHDETCSCPVKKPCGECSCNPIPFEVGAWEDDGGT